LQVSPSKSTSITFPAPACRIHCSLLFFQAWLLCGPHSIYIKM
jgi:hypothetical protein